MMAHTINSIAPSRLDWPRKLLREPAADRSTGQGEQRQPGVKAPFETHAKLAEGGEPSMRAFDRLPSRSSRSTPSRNACLESCHFHRANSAIE
jgi:hypothetical protein